MLASSLAGFLWYQFGANVTFVVSAVMVLGVVLYIALIRTRLTVKL
jgi:hypothetical protein